MKNYYFLCTFFFLASVFFVSCSQQQINVGLLLDEMTNRDQLAQVSQYSFKTLQASSYSRRSVDAARESWFDNVDASWFVRTDTIEGRIEYVLMDVEGPGAIVRMWNAWHAQTFSMGTLRFYFDYSEIPQFEARIDQVISSNPYVGSTLSQVTAPFLEDGVWYSGHNLYFPFPYAKHCKVTYEVADKNKKESSFFDLKLKDILYYQINYRKYKKRTAVKTYQKGDLESGRYTEAIKTVNGQLNDPGQIPVGLEFANLEGVIKPGQVVSRLLDGARAIKQLSIKIDADNLEQALRSTVISMEFDGKQTVWVPLGDFFGTGYKVSPYQSRYSQVTKDGEMNMWFPMPFHKSAKVSLYNHGGQDVKVEHMEIKTSDWNWDDKSLYFHANWRLYNDIATNEKQDVNFITISGTGKHVGDALTLYNNSYQWWGEGDEKIYVDGETFPSHFGTGTEDYYGYAWCSVVKFFNPFLAQPCGEGNRSPGMTVNSRWRMLDVVPFNNSYRFDMELWHWDTTIKMDYAPTVFWYGTYDSKVEYQNDVQKVQIPVKLSNRFEGENFNVTGINGGEVITEAFLSYDWSARNHLLWREIKEGDKLETTFSSPGERKGTLQIVFTHGPEYAATDVFLNGNLVLENIDCFNNNLKLNEYTANDVTIRKGENKLVFVCKRTRDKNVDKLGFDYLTIE